MAGRAPRRRPADRGALAGGLGLRSARLVRFGLLVQMGLLWATAGRSALSQVVLPPDLGVAAGGTRPSPGYDLGFAALAEGRFSAALELAQAEYGSASRTGNQRWIDSIAAAALLAECHHERGDLPAAVAAADEALLIYAVHANWLLAVQFGGGAPRPIDAPRGAAWGRSGRNTTPVRTPDTVAIRQGTADPQEVLKRGGVLTAPSDRPIRPLEIMRALVLALYREGDLLGELARDWPPLDGAARGLSRRAAPPAHASQSWVDVALGTALWAQGKAEQARPLLERGTVLDGRFDHALTSWALIVLGRISLEAGQPAEAARLFEEASYSAHDFRDERALQEALRWAFAAHQAAGPRGVPTSIARAGDWAARSDAGLPVLAARLRAWQAEGLAVSGNLAAAATALAAVDARLLRGEPGSGMLGAEVGYARAMIGYANGGIPQADADLAAALAIAQARSPRLYQTSRALDLVRGAAGLSDRRAQEIFSRLLAAPTARELAVDPLATLATLTVPRAEAFAAWVGIANRRGEEAGLDAAEAALGERWQCVQAVGGRRVAVERLLDAAVSELPADLAAQRAALLGPRPDLAAAIERMRQVRGTLAAASLAAAPAGARPRNGPAGAAADWTTLGELGRIRSRHVAAIAAGREGIGRDFPPLVPTATLRRLLRPRQLILSFRWTEGRLVGLLESRDRSAGWEVRQAAGLPREIGLLARGLGLHDPAAPVPVDRLVAGDWSGCVERIERMLFENSKVTLAEGIDELVIVPDAWLWYLPFELLPLPTGSGPAGRRLRDVCRVSYCPTRSLAVCGGDRMPGGGPIGVHAGRMNRGDKPATAAALVDEVVGRVDRAVPLPLSAATPPPVLAADICEALVIFEEIAADRPAALRMLVPAGAGQPGISFAEWLASPRKRPRLVVLPGLQTAISGAFRPEPARPGAELFATALDLAAAGADAAVVSRWRVGGHTAVELVSEFLRDATAPVPDGMPPPGAAESWRRAVDLVTAEWPDPQREPRLKPHPEAAIGPGSHPFLWSGYMLIECGSVPPHE